MNKYINPNEYGSLLYDGKEKEYVSNVINERRIFRYSRCDHPYTSMCEDRIKEIVNTKYALCTTNGTSGLKTALIGANIGKNDRVLISAYTFLATALAPISIGAIPVPIDVDLETGLDLDDLQEEIKKGCKAIIVVHFQGRAFNLTKIKKLCKDNNIVLIEDACQAFGAKYKNKYTGTMGDIGVYSFQQFKQISSGEGGCIVTNNKKYYERMRNYTDMGSVRDHFPSWNSEDALFGENYRMNNLIGAVLYAQLEKFEDIIKIQKIKRKELLVSLDGLIKNIISSKDPEGDTSMNILILLNDFESKQQAISLAKEQDIELRNMWSSLYYDNDLFRRNNYDSLSIKNKECLKTKELIDRMVVISIPPTLSNESSKRIKELLIDLKNRNLME